MWNENTDNIFSIFRNNSSKTYLPFTGANKQITEPAQRSSNVNNGISNAITQAFDRLPLWFGNSFIPNINPVIESSLYWPLSIQNKVIVTNCVIGSNLVSLNPPAGKHWIMLSWLHDHPTSSVADSVSLMYTPRGSGINAPIGSSVTVAQSSMATNSQVFLVGGFLQHLFNDGAHVPHEYSQRGRNPLYVGGNVQLLIVIQSSVIGNAQEEIAYIELPENQPFGNLAGII